MNSVDTMRRFSRPISLPSCSRTFSAETIDLGEGRRDKGKHGIGSEGRALGGGAAAP